MGGVYIDCGSFSGADKSGKPLLFVLAALHPAADPGALPALTRLIARVAVMLHTSASTVTEVAPDDAQALLPGLRNYRLQLQQRYAEMCDDPVAMASDGNAGLAGIGRQYACAIDLERAFEASVAERRPTIVSWD